MKVTANASIIASIALLSFFINEEALANNLLCPRIPGAQWTKSSAVLGKGGEFKCYYSNGSMLGGKNQLQCLPTAYFMPNNWINGTCTKSAYACQLIVAHPEKC